ncbi:DUF4296 domain-containing protein [Sediminibacterium sp.]|uniref:DUF4296 domain-containing protein n=1 Tax=Sediminibacterium sp. TaxID=1917865 RepID=UPI003F727D82
MKNVLFLFLIVLTMACAGETIPKQVIPIKEMTPIMWDIMKMDEYYVRLTSKDSLNKLTKENIRLYDQVFRSYGINRKTFYDSYAYYESHPAQFKVLVDSIDALSNRQRSLLYQKTQPIKK